MMTATLLQGALLLAVLPPAGAVPLLSWGPAGHRIIAEMALRSLPASIPSFVQQNQSLISFFSIEPDRWRVYGRRKRIHRRKADRWCRNAG
ncbi:MAG: hypothetical protein HY649_01130 [Acidobacteria bacterium]|nr:hypothetical protein [Acidobacteriota bacterium]